MDLPDPLLRFLLEGCRIRCEIRILISKQLVRDFARQDHTDIGLLMDCPADQIHPHAGPDGRDIISAKQVDHVPEGGDHLFRRHKYFCMMAPDKLRDLSRIFQIDRVLFHADCEGLDRLPALSCSNGTDEGRVQSAGKQKSDLCIGNQALFHTADQLVPDLSAGGFKIVPADCLRLRNIAVRDEFPVFVIASRREGLNAVCQADQVFGFTGKYHHAFFIIAVIERPDPDRISCGNILPGLSVIEHTGKLGIQHGKHIRPVLSVQREQDFTVAVAPERIALLLKLRLQCRKAIDLAVADDIAAVQFERLHAGWRESHDGKPVKSEQAVSRVDDPAVVRSP